MAEGRKSWGGNPSIQFNFLTICTYYFTDIFILKKKSTNVKWLYLYLKVPWPFKKLRNILRKSHPVKITPDP